MRTRLALSAALLLSASVRAQTATPEPPAPRPSSSAIPTPSEPPKATASITVGYILVPFVVRDLKGKPVQDLKEKDITLLADDQIVANDLFEKSNDAPISFTILLDGSGSMGLIGKMEGAKAAIYALLDQRRPGDDFSLWVFAGGAVEEIVPFTQDVAHVRRAVDAVKPYGTTAFYDALAKMPDKSILGKNGARAIILMTDGVDNASVLTRQQLEDLLEGVDVPVYPLGLRSAGAPVTDQPGITADELLNIEVLGHVARLSGGRLAIFDDPTKLEGAIRDVEKDLRAQYLIGFAPTGKGPVRYRRLALKLAGPVRIIRVRAGYRGTEPPIRGAPNPKKKGSGRGKR